MYFIHFLKCSESSFDNNVSFTIMKSFFITIQVFIFGYSIIYLFQQPIISQVRIIENNRLDHKSQSNVPSIAILETDYEFRDKIKDETAFPFIETNISVNLGSYFFKSFLQDGSVLSYSPQGEKELFHNCRGILCLVVTNKNSTETSLKNRNISHYGIKEDTIHFYSFDKVFKYEKDSNEITEEFLDKN